MSAARRKLIEIRGFAQSLFGSDRAGEIVAIDGNTAFEPELLWRQAEHTLSRLEDPELVLPPPSSGAVTFDPAGYAAELAPEVTALRQVIDEIELDRRVKATTQKVKDDAMDEHDLLMGACGRILSGLCLLAPPSGPGEADPHPVPQPRRRGSAGRRCSAQCSGLRRRHES